MAYRKPKDKAPKQASVTEDFRIAALSALNNFISSEDEGNILFYGWWIPFLA
jgi:hypothetical protein